MTPRDTVTQSESSSVPATVDAARSWPVPAIVAAEGDKAGERFFTSKNTRAAYFRNACRFMAWCEGRGLTLNQGVQLRSSGDSAQTTRQSVTIAQQRCVPCKPSEAEPGATGAWRSMSGFPDVEPPRPAGR
jgi:hypothetical protein